MSNHEIINLSEILGAPLAVVCAPALLKKLKSLFTTS